MPAEATIKAKYKKLHDDLSAIYYDGTIELSKVDFDSQHGLIWNTMRDELIEAGYFTWPEPKRDLAAEIDALKEDIEKLKE